MATAADLDEIVRRARALAAGPARSVVGVVGPPGAGKSTVAAALVRELGDAVALVPMDGFHLADVELRRLGRLARKGAPDTFDADGYRALLRRLRADAAGETVYAPAFERELEQPIAGSIAVDPATRLVVTEGNYLLLDTPPWAAVRDLLDQAWWVDSDPGLRHERLVARHIRFGKADAAARQWVDQVDEPNARLVNSGRARADLIIRALPPLPAEPITHTL